MKHVPAGAMLTTGYDVSHYQNNMHIHEQMQAAGKKFCIIKADEGATIVDHLFKAHYQAAKAAGMIVGFYNFFHPKQDAHKQAAHMLSLIGSLQNDLGAMIDWETTDGISGVLDRDRGYQFLCEVEAALKKTPLLYTGPYFWRDQVGGENDLRFSRFHLVIAHYGLKPSVGPLVPGPWKTWDFWQYSETGGIDFDFYNGSLDQLKALALKL